MTEEKDRFGELIKTALREENAHSALPDDFSRRLLCGIDSSSAAGNQVRVPRWIKAACAFAATASFAAFAAWVGVAVLGADEPESEICAPAHPQNDAQMQLPRTGSGTVMARKMASPVGAAMVTVEVPVAELTSEETFVFLRPETSSFWNTATNSSMTVPIDFPNGAHSAALTVKGDGYVRRYEDIRESSFTFDLPRPVSPETENVYDLVLAFDSGETKSARLGLIQGLSPDAEGMTRCLAPQTARVWSKVNGRAVLPIPYGTVSFTVNGVETDTGLDGAQGWYAINGLGFGVNASLGLLAGGVQYAASLIGGPGGIMLIVK